MTDKNRFRDTHEVIYDFLDECLVVCPQCNACAYIMIRDPQQWILFAPRHLVCPNCAFTKDWQGHGVGFNGPYDPYFQLPLWLQVEVQGHILWAYNLRHLKLIEDFVDARLRERRVSDSTGWRNQSVISRLPTWIKVAKNRPHILKAIERLKRKYHDCGRAVATSTK